MHRWPCAELAGRPVAPGPAETAAPRPTTSTWLFPQMVVPVHSGPWMAVTTHPPGKGDYFMIQ
jgi:hypothetical protein